jgi:hypothetical protein
VGPEELKRQEVPLEEVRQPQDRQARVEMLPTRTQTEEAEEEEECSEEEEDDLVQEAEDRP